MQNKIPKMVVPQFWLVNFGRVQNYLSQRVREGKLCKVGKSSLGYPIPAVEYGRRGCVRLRNTMIGPIEKFSAESASSVLTTSWHGDKILA